MDETGSSGRRSAGGGARPCVAVDADAGADAGVVCDPASGGGGYVDDGVVVDDGSGVSVDYGGYDDGTGYDDSTGYDDTTGDPPADPGDEGTVDDSGGGGSGDEGSTTESYRVKSARKGRKDAP